MNPTSPIRLLSVGNIVSAGFRLYNDNRKQYLIPSLRAFGWGLLLLGFFALAIGLMIGGAVWLATANIESSGSSGASGGAILLLLFGGVLLLGGIPLWIFCAAKIIYNETLITANAFSHLSHQPEPVKQTDQRLKSKTWLFWLAKVLVGLVLYAVSFGFSIMQQIFLPFISMDNKTIAALAGMLFFLAVIAQYCAQFWLTIRLFFVEVILALQPEVKTINCVERSWKLTRQSFWRIATVLFVGFLITCPLYILTIVPAGLILLAFIPWESMSELGSGSGSELASRFLIGGSFALGTYLLLLQVIQIFILPFWQTIKAVLYYDLRSRREGFGLSLDDRG
ncbi:MAG: hypothetical protein RLZZ511_1845 [Cyanobacteriota bacterium]|jgi:hypothetical protein